MLVVVRKGDITSLEFCVLENRALEIFSFARELGCPKNPSEGQFDRCIKIEIVDLWV